MEDTRRISYIFFFNIEETVMRLLSYNASIRCPIHKHFNGETILHDVFLGKSDVNTEEKSYGFEYIGLKYM